MDFSTHKVLEQATYRTLHAHSFSRSSSQASLALTDLLSRYLTLLSLTCAKYAQHAGRNGLTARDAFCALEELGISMEELGEYCTSEGNELRRYAVHTARRVEDLNELKAHLAVGLKQDKPIIPLHYAPLSSSTLLDESDEEDSEDEAEGEAMRVDQDERVADTGAVDPLQGWASLPIHRPPPTLPLPLSPISNPSSPSRKRPRMENWRPPAHIPDFLPPFPNDRESPPRSLVPQSPRAPPIQPPPRKVEKPPSPLPQPLAPTSASDYLTQVPYLQSTLASLPEWHLPSPAPSQPSSQMRPPCLPTPQTQPALFAAYHHILTHPPPPNPNSAHPARHKVAMALLSQTQTSPRWEPSDTLYSGVAPCQPRVAPIGYSWPVPISRTPPSDMKPPRPEDKDKEPKLPTAPARPVSVTERLTPLVSQQPSRIPELARHILPRSVHFRATRLTHPPALYRNGHKLVYGPGIDAPWNAGAAPAAATTLTPGKVKDAPPNGLSNGKGKETVSRVLQDARLYATWDYEQKDFKEPLALARRGRTGSVQGGPTLSLGTGGRGRSGSKMGA